MRGLLPSRMGRRKLSHVWLLAKYGGLLTGLTAVLGNVRIQVLRGVMCFEGDDVLDLVETASPPIGKRSGNSVMPILSRGKGRSWGCPPSSLPELRSEF